jgi:hypothetical protein
MRRTSRWAALPALALLTLVPACSSATTTSAASSETVIATTEDAAATVTVATDDAVDHDEPADHEWDPADELAVSLEGGTATATGAGVTVDGSTVTVTSAGTYRLSGSLTDGQVVVNTTDAGIVRLVLDGVDLTSSTTAPLVVTDAEEVMVVLADGTQNTLTDAAEYAYPDAATDEPNAALFSTADLTLAGDGALTVEGNAHDGIASKDGLVITGGDVTVTAADDGVRGKDYLVVEGGTLDVTSGGDGLKSDDDEDATQGYVSVTAGSVTVDAGGDGVDAFTDVVVTGGELSVTAGGGAGGTVADDVSAKGLKGAVSVVVGGGTVDVDAADDALHSNGAVTVTDGTVTLASGDDGVHADATLTVAGGSVTVTESYEGLESAVITVSGGAVDVTASDDGLNVAGGVDGSGQEAQDAGAREGGPGGGGGAAPSQDGFAEETDTSGYLLTISGGTVLVDADGDGLDSNGSVVMTGGTVAVDGPTEQMNAPIDVNAGFDISGGVLVAAGSAGMAQMPDASSAQASLGLTLGSTYPAGTVVHVTADDGTHVATFTAGKSFESFVLSAPELVAGASYTIAVGGTAGTAVLGGYAADGDASTATALGSATASGS